MCKNSEQTAHWEMQPRLAPCSCSTQAPCRQHVTLCKLTATHTSKRSNITQNNDARLFLSPNCWWTLKVLVFKPAVDDGRRCRKAPGVHVRRSRTFHLPPSLSGTYLQHKQTVQAVPFHLRSLTFRYESKRTQATSIVLHTQRP